MNETDAHANFQRAYTALQGLSIGDSLGGFFEFGSSAVLQRIAQRSLPNVEWHFTDDTMMALSVVETLRDFKGIQQDVLAQSLSKYYDRSRGYGPATRNVLARIRNGEVWHKAAYSTFNGQGSFGNGAAVRVSPIGAYFAEDFDAIVTHARLSAEVTHPHPEGIAGAIAVAVAAAWAYQCRETATTTTRQEFLSHILTYVPDSDVKRGITEALALPLDTAVDTAAKTLGNGSKVSCQDTVPFALWCAAEHLNNYENAIWSALQGLGDCDTICAIVGGIVVMCTGVAAIPSSWLTSREPLPDWILPDS